MKNTQYKAPYVPLYNRQAKNMFFYAITCCYLHHWSEMAEACLSI